MASNAQVHARDRVGGRYVTSGAISGPVVPLDLRTLYLRDLRLFGGALEREILVEDLEQPLELGEGRCPLESEVHLGVGPRREVGERGGHRGRRQLL